MPIGKISTSNNTIELQLPNGEYVSEQVESLSSAYDLLIGSDVLANDSCCYILIFDHSLWVVPDSTAGFNALNKQLPNLIGQHRITTARIDYLPFSWRARRFLLGMEGRLAIKSREAIDDIEDVMTVLNDVDFVNLM
ncbi:hypothetical protein [Oceanobacter mangrovi]|uniref:hypothetical protein n=1 Tax=Oceanobacter mangrovi TaxID=2862510 RepID=UPI001C8D097D|nr:hypothetical protein [Oceanobacter mangrovi]